MGFKLSKKNFTEKQESTKTCKLNTNTNKNTHSTVTKIRLQLWQLPWQDVGIVNCVTDRSRLQGLTLVRKNMIGNNSFRNLEYWSRSGDVTVDISFEQVLQFDPIEENHKVAGSIAHILELLEYLKNMWRYLKIQEMLEIFSLSL